MKAISSLPRAFSIPHNQARWLVRRAHSASKRLNRLPAAYYRGGTSRAIMFKEHDLPKDRTSWDSIFLGAIGSPDRNGRQLDGMGGGISSLSKVCVVGKSRHESGADVDYTFAALGVKTTEVDYSSNCGNMTSAVGPFAIDAGLVDAENVKKSKDGNAIVRIHNTNTGKIIDAAFPLDGDKAASHGDFAIDGVDGTAARIELAFLNPAGSKTGKLMPTGNPYDVIDGVKVSLIDCGNPCCFVNAAELGVDGTILPDIIEAHPNLLPRLEKIRRKASVMMGLSRDEVSASGSVPKVSMVSAPTKHKIASGEEVGASSVDIIVRAISVGQPHRAVPITVAMAVAAASRIDGSTVNSVKGVESVDPNALTIGHSSGKIVVGANFDDVGALTNATVFRTARLLMDGNVYWK